MLKIIIYSEFPNESPNSDEHIKRISEFKQAVKIVLSDLKGEIQFDYISNYKQFETKKLTISQTELTKEQVSKIEQIIPNCWI